MFEVSYGVPALIRLVGETWPGQLKPDVMHFTTQPLDKKTSRILSPTTRRYTITNDLMHHPPKH